jgi:TRAP-type uncharacterized transport system fused permease subunit
VALATFAAAPLAGVSAMRIGMVSMRLGVSIYLVPFCFVLNPALLLKGDPASVTLAIAAAFAGVMVMAAALQGYVAGLGLIPASAAGWLVRAALIAGGSLLAAPSERLTGLSLASNLAAGMVLVILGLSLLSALVGRARIGRTSA